MGPVLEPLGAASQGVGSCFSRNSTRGVERLLELELYSPKEREGYILGNLGSKSFQDSVRLNLPVECDRHLGPF